MLIGVLSDIHDNLDNLIQALAIFRERGVKALIFCGDFCSPIPSRVMAGEFQGDVHCVFGNGDGDKFLMLHVAKTQYPNLKLHGEYAELEFEGVKVAVTHYPFYARALARTGDYQAVFSGHTHEASQERINDCLWLNPGDVMGWKGKSSCAVYDTATNSGEIVSIE
ncbi:MAG: metallophosphoesterase [Anaerolineales bacterium]|nr:MAG: metallophosphoesterase [Anaerolineales bacterium]